LRGHDLNKKGGRKSRPGKKIIGKAAVKVTVLGGKKKTGQEGRMIRGGGQGSGEEKREVLSEVKLFTQFFYMSGDSKEKRARRDRRAGRSLQGRIKKTGGGGVR